MNSIKQKHIYFHANTCSGILYQQYIWAHLQRRNTYEIANCDSKKFCFDFYDEFVVNVCIGKPELRKHPRTGQDAEGTQETATPLTLGTPYTETIDADDVDYFRIEVDQPGRLTVWTTGDLDTEGELQNSAGTIIVENDDGGSRNNFRIVYTVKPGTYYLRVIAKATEFWGETGSYTVHAVLEPGQSAGPKIEGPWLWMLVPAKGKSGIEVEVGIDYLAEASGGP